MDTPPDNIPTPAARSKRAPFNRNWPFLVPLVIQNLIVYWDHYFGNSGFPWDFSMSYYAMVAFWTAAIGQGVFPEWIPFQQMGYPFALQLQSGLNYLPLWIFPATNIPYTLRAAIVFQCVHVLIGTIGMFMLARQLQSSRSHALVASIAFQFFGGFYSNAQHVDIVRAYAAAPWLLYVFSLDARSGRLPRRAMLTPILLYFFITGAYPGNVIAAGIIIPLFIGLQLLDARVSGVPASQLISLSMRIGGLSVLGVGMAFVHLAPIWLFREQFSRGGPPSSDRVGLWLEHLPGLFLSNRTLPGEISMTSTYVTLPLLVFAAFTPGALLKRYWAYLALAVVAAVMAAGDHIAAGSYLTTAMPLFRLSRFPSSDYRVFVAIPLMLFAIFALRAIEEKQLTARSMSVRILLCMAVVFWGLSSVYAITATESVMTIVIATASLAVVATVGSGRTPLTLAGLIAVCALISIDATRVLTDMPSWRQPDIEGYYLEQRWPAYLQSDRRSLLASSIFPNPPTARPPRIDPAGLVRWSGYNDGRYYTTDLTPNVLRSTSVVAANALYQQYMLREWLPILLPPDESAVAHSAVTVAERDIARGLASAASDPGGTVRQTSYGVNDIVYAVELSEPRLMVENEMYFPGWRARLHTPHEHTIDAIAANGVFRSWLLPSGRYSMVAHFEFPHREVLRFISVSSFVIWLAAWAVWRHRNRVMAQAAV